MRSAAIVVLGAGLAWAASADAAVLPRVTIDYPEEGSIFPPRSPRPPSSGATPPEMRRAWRIEVTFADGCARHPRPIRGRAAEHRRDRSALRVEHQRAAPADAAAGRGAYLDSGRRTIWSADQAALRGAAGDGDRHHRLPRRGNSATRSRAARSTIQTSKDPVGAPIFYRDVPLMPSELEKGVIKPLAPAAIPLIAWRLRDIAEPRSRVVLEGMHTCANCHSFSADGKTLGMDLDGPQNDKGLYAIVAGAAADVDPQRRRDYVEIVSRPAFRPDARRLHVADLARRAIRRDHRRRGRRT